MSEVGTVARLTSSLNEVENDTGRVAFCGPYVLSAITGYPISRVEEEIRILREVPEGRQSRIGGREFSRDVSEDCAQGAVTRTGCGNGCGCAAAQCAGYLAATG